jgi:hypothetical protein
VRPITLVVVLACAPLAAQNEGQLQSEFRREGEAFKKNCTSFKSLFGCGQLLFTGKPLHITAGSIAPQNGVGLGPAFVYEKNFTNWRLSTNADAVVSTNQSWRAGLYLKAVPTRRAPPVVITTRPPGGQAPAPAPAPQLNFYLQAISLNRVDYYGLGEFTSKDALAVFKMRETIVGGSAVYPLFGASGLALYGESNGRFVDIEDSHAGDQLSIFERYFPPAVPGLLRQPGYFQAGEGVRFVRPLFNARLDLNYSTLYQQFVASDSTYSFQRLTLDFNHEIPLYRSARSVPAISQVGPDESPRALEENRYTRNRQGTIGLQVFLSESFTGRDGIVPFYFQPTLGGVDINGNRALPSYPDYRFRAPNLLLFRGSFEHSIWGPLGAALMADWGRVALRRADLGFEHFRHSYAAGVTLRAGGFPQVWLLFAWGGGDTHAIAYINPSLLGGSSRPPLY